MQTGGKMQTVDSDCRLLKCIVLPFPLSRANRKQANLSVTQAHRLQNAACYYLRVVSYLLEDRLVFQAYSSTSQTFILFVLEFADER